MTITVVSLSGKVIDILEKEENPFKIGEEIEIEMNDINNISYLYKVKNIRHYCRSSKLNKLVLHHTKVTVVRS